MTSKGSTIVRAPINRTRYIAINNPRTDGERFVIGEKKLMKSQPKKHLAEPC